MGRLPMGTSFTVLFSNMRLSLGISVSSRGAVLARVFASPGTQPGKPTFGLVLQTNHDYGDVVGAATLVGESNEALGSFLRVGFRLQGAGDFRFRHHTRKPVGAEKQNVTREESLLFGIHFDLRLSPERAQQNALHVTLFGFVRADDSAPDLLSNKRMVAGEL